MDRLELDYDQYYYSHYEKTDQFVTLLISIRLRSSF